EGLERRDAGTQVPRFVSGRQGYSTLEAEDRAAAAVGNNRPLISDTEIADTADPACVFRVKEAEWDGKLQLVSHAKAFFITEFARDVTWTLGIDGGCQDRFVLGEGLLCNERARQVQFTERPFRLAAERAQILGHHVDLF